MSAPFDPRDPKWKLCVVGCRPAAGMHVLGCANVDAYVLPPYTPFGRTAEKKPRARRS